MVPNLCCLISLCESATPCAQDEDDELGFDPKNVTFARLRLAEKSVEKYKAPARKPKKVVEEEEP